MSRFLDDLEEQTSLDTPDAEAGEGGTVQFDLTGNFGVHVVVKGSIRDLPELESAVARLLREMGESNPRNP